jgi:hypothetical protein
MTSPEPRQSRSLEGTRWRGASGGVFTVEGVLPNGVAYGKWDSGNLWSEHASMLSELYVEVENDEL